MATFITVEQEGNPLLRRNKEQTQANRLNKVEGDEQRRTEQQAREARRQQLQQQGLDASGNVVGDGRRRRFRMDEPAATLLGSRVLIVTWNGVQPVLSDKRAVLVSGESHPNASSTTITVGTTAAALAMSGESSNSYWRYKTIQSRIRGGSDFTYEAWVQFVSSPYSASTIQILDGDIPFMEMGYYYTDGTSPDLAQGFYFSITDPIDGSLGALSGSTSVPLSQPQHFCIMRKNGNFYWAINGFIFTTNTTPEAQAVLLTSDTQIDFALYALGNQAPNKLGPLRLDPDRARYDINGFTPDPLPFRP